jgi:hypothetical protein
MKLEKEMGVLETQSRYADAQRVRLTSSAAGTDHGRVTQSLRFWRYFGAQIVETQTPPHTPRQGWSTHGMVQKCNVSTSSYDACLLRLHVSSVHPATEPRFLATRSKSHTVKEHEKILVSKL